MSSETSQLIDIYDVVPAPEGTSWGWFLLCICIFILVAGVVFWLKRKNRDKSKDCLSNQLAWEVALEELNKVSLEDQPKDVYLKLSLIFRVYTESCFQIKALEMTFKELKDSINGFDLSDSLKRDITAFLKRAEEIKFSPFSKMADIDSDIQLIKVFIKDTRNLDGI